MFSLHEFHWVVVDFCSDCFVLFSKKHAVNWTLVFLIATPAVALVWFMLGSAFGG
ncbi:hypothetical protein [Companilactobacillus zhongbaensis]|uniref:hypothetical protein n=1 Tax=Companilactobacillus zhongbaensis TaxID=2486009 RepID=UPI0013DDB21F|nr:hypothetical protein [Companilactobacillus zhongbaensis]